MPLAMAQIDGFYHSCINEGLAAGGALPYGAYVDLNPRMFTDYVSQLTAATAACVLSGNAPPLPDVIRLLNCVNCCNVEERFHVEYLPGECDHGWRELFFRM